MTKEKLKEKIKKLENPFGYRVKPVFRIANHKFYELYDFIKKFKIPMDEKILSSSFIQIHSLIRSSQRADFGNTNLIFDINKFHHEIFDKAQLNIVFCGYKYITTPNDYKYPNLEQIFFYTINLKSSEDNYFQKIY